jgi:lambda family phage portal protein
MTMDPLSMRAWEPAPLPEPAKREINLPIGTGVGAFYKGAAIYGGGFLQAMRSKDQEIRRDSLGLRSNSRRLQNNNPFMARYLRSLGGHVVGPNGFTFQSTFKSKGGARRDPYAGKIEEAMSTWSKRGNCTVCGKFSLIAAERMFVRTMALDGECFVRIVRGYPNAWGFALQFLDADLLDHTYSISRGNGQNAVVMGIEVNSYGRPVAYHFTDPGDAATYWPRGRRIRIHAADIIHGFDPDRAIQTRGVPWIACSMYLISMLGHYWEAEVTAARHEAERVAFIKSPSGGLDEEDDDRQGVAPGDPMKAAASMPSGEGGIYYQGIPANMDVQVPDLKHPNSGLEGFSKSMLKGISAGGGVSYASMSNDLTEVSFSSIRQGTLEDREYYQELQGLVVDTFLERVANEFIYMSVLTGALTMPPGVTFERFCAHAWEPRGWDWVDPKSDMLAKVGAVDAALDTRTRILAERGLNFDDVVDRLKYENDRLKEAGIVPKAPPTSLKAADAEPEGEAPKPAAKKEGE